MVQYPGVPTAQLLCNSCTRSHCQGGAGCLTARSFHLNTTRSCLHSKQLMCARILVGLNKDVTLSQHRLCIVRSAILHNTEGSSLGMHCLFLRCNVCCAVCCRVNRAVLLLELVVPVVTAVQLQACPTQLCWHPSSAA